MIVDCRVYRDSPVERMGEPDRRTQFAHAQFRLRTGCKQGCRRDDGDAFRLKPAEVALVEGQDILDLPDEHHGNQSRVVHLFADNGVSNDEPL
jgi:hypothetical protein